MFGFFRKKNTEFPPEAEIVQEKVPAAERRIYVIDFDRTITILHTGALAYGNELSPTFIQKNVKKGFADFVQAVIQRGHTVYIASYSDDSNVDLVEGEALSGHDLIKCYMDLIFGQDQTIFTSALTQNDADQTGTAGNIIAINSQDLKQYHLGVILRQEGLDENNPNDMKRIYLLEDDEDVVRFFMEKGCTIIVPYSASRSADTAATPTLFTSYLPPEFRA
jgi:hypothetical protein